MRIGNGFDIHRLVPNRPLILGGINIPYDLGLLGHSDGDALTHAIIDSLLGALALGNIGTWFPPGDDQYKNADSLELLQKVLVPLQEHEYKISNIDSVIICEKPKLAPYIDSMRERLSQVLAISISQMSIKATTAEGLGPIGQSGAIAVQAVALIG